jgi:hypothetical protein
MIRLLVVGRLAWSAARRLRLGRPDLAGAVAAVTVAAPLAGLALAAVVVAGRRWRVAAARTARSRDDERSASLFADLVSLGLTAGLSLRAAVVAARVHVDGSLRGEVDDLVAGMDRVGVAPALAAVEGTLSDFGRVAAGAAASGAPVAAAVAAFAATRRQVDHAERVAAARRLPVRLLLPLALLILPGFVVLAVGPALLQALARLGPVP